MSFSSFFTLFKQSFSGWNKDQATVWCAALAYYTLFSIGPLLLIILSIVGFVFSKNNLEANIFGQIESLLGSDGAKMMESVIANSKNTSSSILGLVSGLITLALGAIGVFAQLQQMLNKIWGVTQKPKSGLMPFIESRLLNLSLVGVIAFLLLVSLLISTFIASIGTYFKYLLPFSPFILESINLITSFVVISILFGFILKVLPDVELKFKDVWLGAILTSVLFTVGKTLIGLYIGNNGVASSFGAAGSIIVLLLWVYYSSQILFFGAEFTKFHFLSQGRKIKPSKYSILNEEAKMERKEKGEKVEVSLAKRFTKGFIKKAAKKAKA